MKTSPKPTVRLCFSIPPETDLAMREAAALSRVTLTEFLRISLNEKAASVLAKHEAA